MKMCFEWGVSTIHLYRTVLGPFPFAVFHRATSSVLEYIKYSSLLKLHRAIGAMVYKISHSYHSNDFTSSILIGCSVQHCCADDSKIRTENRYTVAPVETNLKGP